MCSIGTLGLLDFGLSSSNSVFFFSFEIQSFMYCLKHHEDMGTTKRNNISRRGKNQQSQEPIPWWHESITRSSSWANPEDFSCIRTFLISSSTLNTFQDRTNKVVQNYEKGIVFKNAFYIFLIIWEERGGWGAIETETSEVFCM